MKPVMKMMNPPQAVMKMMMPMRGIGIRWWIGMRRGIGMRWGIGKIQQFACRAQSTSKPRKVVIELERRIQQQKQRQRNTAKN